MTKFHVARMEEGKKMKKESNKELRLSVLWKRDPKKKKETLSATAAAFIAGSAAGPAAADATTRRLRRSACRGKWDSKRLRERNQSFEGVTMHPKHFNKTL